MKCANCGFENPDGMNFCGECGTKLVAKCSKCGFENPPDHKFCGECGTKFTSTNATETVEEKTQASIEKTDESGPGKITSAESPTINRKTAKGERKYVTVMFSDLSGYTAMSEKLDPEEVQDVMNKIFGEIAQVIAKFEGYIDKFMGDAVMAFFGIPKAHEDDPVRAVRAALEIHERIKSISPQYQVKIGRPLTMHTGISTGLIVSGEFEADKGRKGMIGDTINLASRLESLSQSDEILISPETYSFVAGYFDFEKRDPVQIKGKVQPVHVHRVLTVKAEPVKTFRSFGVRAELIGRNWELGQLQEAINKLLAGKGGTISIYGEAGSGKSRLVEEIKSSLDKSEISWLEGHAYAYSKNISFFQLINLLNHTFGIEEGDPRSDIQNKLENQVTALVENPDEVIPYVGKLYSIEYEAVKTITSEDWKERLKLAVKKLLSAMVTGKPTIVCLEDLHWSDPSSLELIREMIPEFDEPVLFILMYRPGIELFSEPQKQKMRQPYSEIQLKELSSSEELNMVESLLNTSDVPVKLQQFIREKVQGNPFYIEEVINSLIESGLLVNQNQQWELTRTITQTDLPATIQGVLSARIDRLEKETKRILQEASVIGRSFFYEILSRISEMKENIDTYLTTLETLDLIKAKQKQPELEYIFKHALTQEVVYSGMLIKERQMIHNQIGEVIEKLFTDRLSDFYEALAIHFNLGRNTEKAVKYLTLSGKKSLAQYAVEEAHTYFKEAHNIIDSIENKSETDYQLLAEIFDEWGYVYYYKGNFKEFSKTYLKYEQELINLKDDTILGMYYAWLGACCTWRQGLLSDAYQYSSLALQIGEKTDNQKVIGYACTWLAWVCSLTGRLSQGIEYGKRTQVIAKDYPEDYLLYFKSLAAIGFCFIHQGNLEKGLDVGKKIIQHGKDNNNNRSLVMGHCIAGAANFYKGEFAAAIKDQTHATNIAKDPFYKQFPKIFLVPSYLYQDNHEEALMFARSYLDFSQENDIFDLNVKCYFAVILIIRGEMAKGMDLINEQLAKANKSGEVAYILFTHFSLASLYLNLTMRSSLPPISMFIKNLGFIIKEMPGAAKKAEYHCNKTVELAEKYGYRKNEADAYFNLAQLYQVKKKKEKARKYLGKAIDIFTQCQASGDLKQAQELMEKLG